MLRHLRMLGRAMSVPAAMGTRCFPRPTSSPNDPIPELPDLPPAPPSSSGAALPPPGPLPPPRFRVPTAVTTPVAVRRSQCSSLSELKRAQSLVEPAKMSLTLSKHSSLKSLHLKQPPTFPIFLGYLSLYLSLRAAQIF